MYVLAAIVIALEIYCILISIILVCGLFVHQRQKTTRLLIGVIIVNIFGLASELLYWPLDGIPGQFVNTLLRVNDFINHAAAYLLIIGLAEFLWQYLESKGIAEPSDRRHVVRIRLICYIGIVATAVAAWFSFFTYFDAQNVYYATDNYWLSMVIPFIALSYIACFELKYRKHFNRRETISFFFICNSLPLACVGLQLIHPDLTIAYIYIDASLLILYANIYIEQAQVLQDKELAIAKNRVAAMLSQIKPAYIYDSLAALQTLCLSNPPKAKKTVLDFTQHLRARLDAIAISGPVPFEDELANVQNYLSLETVLRTNAVQVKYAIGAIDFQLPPLSIQSIIEDILSGYGQEDGTSLSISSYETDAFNNVEISSNIPIQDGPPMPSIALVKNSLRSVGGTLAITSPGNTSCCITIQTPKLET